MMYEDKKYEAENEFEYDYRNLRYRVFWTSDDITIALNHLNQNKDDFEKVMKLICDNVDYDVCALEHCMRDNNAETFEEYDSDITEKFIYYFRAACLNTDYTDIDPSLKSFEDYRTYVKSMYNGEGNYGTRDLNMFEQFLVDESGLLFV